MYSACIGEMEIQISFIIPIYNCGSLIGRCLDSIFDSGVKTQYFEIIAVDDGSTDDSTAMVRAYAAKHTNLHLLCQRNNGASAARNSGLWEANGKYIWFVDADDHIVPEFFVSVIKRLTEGEYPEIFSFNYQEIIPDRVISRQLFDKEEEMTGIMFFQRYNNFYLWNKLMRRNVLHHEFLDGTKNLEDLYFCLQNILSCQQVKLLPEYGYYYEHSNTASTSLNLSKRNLIKLSDDTLNIQEHILNDMGKLSQNYKKIYRNTITETTAGHLYSLLRYYPLQRVRYVLNVYKKWHLYPISARTRNKRMNIFISLANNKWLLYLGTIINNIRFHRK